MRTIRIIVLSPVVLSCLALACAKSEPMPAPGVSAPQATMVPSSPRPQAEHVRGGGDPAEALLWATDQIQLPDLQRTTVRSLEDQLSDNQKDTVAAFTAMRRDLAAQVRAGSVDATRVQSDETAAISALQAHVAKEADILNNLHNALDDAQRRAAVAAVRAKESGRTEAQAGTAQAPAMPSDDMTHATIDRLTRELSLDATQQQQLASVLGQQPSSKTGMVQERQHRMDAVLAGFEADTFDAHTLLPPPDRIGDMVRQGADREMAFLNKLLPLLRPEQREQLATSIEQRKLHDRD